MKLTKTRREKVNGSNEEDRNRQVVIEYHGTEDQQEEMAIKENPMEEQKKVEEPQSITFST